MNVDSERRISRTVKIASVVVIVACIVGAGFVYFRAGPSFDDDFRESCLQHARAATDAAGASKPEVVAAQRRMCDCALNLVKAMPAADQQALQTSEEKRQAFAAEVQRRCL